MGRNLPASIEYVNRRVQKGSIKIGGQIRPAAEFEDSGVKG